MYEYTKANPIPVQIPNNVYLFNKFYVIIYYLIDIGTVLFIPLSLYPLYKIYINRIILISIFIIKKQRKQNLHKTL